MTPRFDTAVIIGAGLLGASLGLALKQHHLSRTVRGVGRRMESLNTAQRIGAIDEAFLEIAPACENADLVVIATPAAHVPQALDQVVSLCGPHTIVTDVASTKNIICTHAAKTWPAPRRFVGSHPMAGSEKFGPEHANPDLYQGSITIVEPAPDAAPDARESVQALWKAVGSQVVELDPALHDALVARTSHIPHIVAACLAETAAEKGDVRAVVGKGFRDVTRIAEGRAEIWRDICLTNGEAIAEGLDALIARIQDARRMVKEADAEALDAFFESARDARKHVTGS